MSHTEHVAPVVAPVTVLWRAPDSPRLVDAPMLADEPNHAEWLAGMDLPGTARADSRFGLDDRIDSQVLADEPVIVLERGDEWSHVVAPWQPSHRDARGYPGFVRTAHLGAPVAHHEPPVAVEPAPPTGEQLLATAREYVGLPYLWGGVSPTALDCSGLVHLVCRRYGLTVPRDADDQRVACDPVEVDGERPGDLYFFAHPGKTIHHVGFVTSPGHMLHAPGTGTHIVEEVLPQERVDTLVGTGRIRGLASAPE